jgi:hypothetical protein
MTGTYINGLGVIAEPIAKVNALDIELRELLAAMGAGHEQSEEGVFDIAMHLIQLRNVII